MEIENNVSQGTSRAAAERAARIAFGGIAQASETMSLLFRQGGRLVGLGLVIGVALFWPISFALKQQLFETPAFDPAILIIAFATITLAALMAIALPTRRALRINPIEAPRGG